MSWTQPVCRECYEEKEPGRIPVRISPQYAEEERCCLCGAYTKEGIYYRINPAMVPYPQREK